MPSVWYSRGPAGLPGESPSSGLPGHTHTHLPALAPSSQPGWAHPRVKCYIICKDAHTSFSSTDSETLGKKEAPGKKKEAPSTSDFFLEKEIKVEHTNSKLAVSVGKEAPRGGLHQGEPALRGLLWLPLLSLRSPFNPLGT